MSLNEVHTSDLECAGCALCVLAPWCECFVCTCSLVLVVYAARQVEARSVSFSQTVPLHASQRWRWCAGHEH